MKDQVEAEKNLGIPRDELSKTSELSAEWPKRLAAPLGLSEWECSNGEVYYQRSMAEARQRGLNLANGQDTQQG